MGRAHVVRLSVGGVDVLLRCLGIYRWQRSFQRWEQPCSQRWGRLHPELWDVRTDLSLPMAKVGNAEFDAGVTAVSYHPTVEHVAAVGSYDEMVRLYDVRNWKEPLCRVNVGGGVWRIRWHPKVDGRILVGAMQGGCRVVTVEGLNETDAVLETHIESEFTKHESMAYGADWLVTEGIVCCATDGDGESSPSMINEYAASCSFYDRRVCLWRSTNA